MTIKDQFRTIAVITAFSIVFGSMVHAAPEKESDSYCGSILGITDYTPEEALPSKFPNADTPDDLKAYLSSRYPGVRDQGYFDTGWAHSAMALAEFYAINKLGESNGIDLSEEQLAYGVYRTRPNFVVGNEEALGGVDFDGTDVELLNIGGDLEIAAQFLSKNFGYVKESSFEYTPSPDNEADFGDGMLRSDHSEIYESYDENSIHLLNMYKVDIKSRPDMVKEAIRRNGIVGCSYCTPIGGNSSNGKYYDYGGYTSYRDTVVYDPMSIISPKGPNHVVCIVGWDDDYPIDNFQPDMRPSEKGAWLIRNSRGGGPGFSQNSYFWMSYDTGSLSNAVYIYDVTEVTDDMRRQNYYYYDTQIHNTGKVFDFPGYSVKSANVFTVPKDKEEILTEITAEIGAASPYEVDIYLNPSVPGDPESGEKIENAHVKGEFSFPGIYTIPLGKEIRLSGGDTFAVVITMDKNVMYECSYGAYYSTCDIKAGQSFVYFSTNTSFEEGKYNYNKGWMDKKDFYEGANFCICAHTKNAEGVKEKLSASDFTFSAPTSLEQNGNPHAATVVSKNKDVGEITVLYEYTLSDGTNEWRNTPPTESGTYRVKINVAANDTYSSARDLREESWVFTIKGSSSGDDPGKKDPGNDDPGNNDPGNNDPGNDDPENNDPGNDDPEKDKDNVTDENIVKVPVKIQGGGNVEIIFNRPDKTWKTKDGKDVLVISLESGSDPGTPSYSYTGKKLTPGKNSFVVYKGVLYEYGSSYRISFKNNKNAGAAKAIIKWKKGSAPYADGKKIEKGFTISPRAVSANMVDYMLKNGKVKKLTVTDDGIVLKPKKKDFSYSFVNNILVIDFKNNFSGSLRITN